MLPNGKDNQPPIDPDMMTKTSAIIQSLERMCTEARTRELHKDAAIAVLQEQLGKAQRELMALKAKYEPAEKPGPELVAIKGGKGKRAEAKA